MTDSDSSVIQPITTQQRQQVIDHTQICIEQAAGLFGKKFKLIDTLFDLTGRNAGMYRVQGKQRWIRYNPYIFSRYFNDSLATTVPHEVAHYIADCLYGLKNIRPHGNEWKMVMQQFGVKAEVTGNYDLQGIPQRRQKRYSYQCGCRQHEISRVRHRRIIRKQARYYCKHCKQPIRIASQL